MISNCHTPLNWPNYVVIGIQTQSEGGKKWMKFTERTDSKVYLTHFLSETENL